VTGTARLRPLQLMFAAGSLKAPVVALRGERPGKNERPPIITGFTPSAIMSPGLNSPCTQIRLGDVRAFPEAASTVLNRPSGGPMTWPTPGAAHQRRGIRRIVLDSHL